MPCTKLDTLRQQASETRAEFLARQRRAREHAAAGLLAPSSGSDYEGYLGRKLQRLAQEIDQHRADHRCDEL